MAVLCWSSHEEIPHTQGKRNPSKMVGVARGHQRANTLKPYSQMLDHLILSQRSKFFFSTIFSAYVFCYWQLQLMFSNPSIFSSVGFAGMHAKPCQSCPTLCSPVHCSPPGFSVHGILQARILEWVAMPSSRGSSRPRDQIQVSCVSCIGRWVLYS